MGLLDTRDPPSYSAKLEKIKPADNTLLKVLSRKRRTTASAGVPKYTFSVFTNNLMAQQGLPGGFKVALLFVGLYFPGMLVYYAASRKHPMREEF